MLLVTGRLASAGNTVRKLDDVGLTTVMFIAAAVAETGMSHSPCTPLTEAEIGLASTEWLGQQPDIAGLPGVHQATRRDRHEQRAAVARRRRSGQHASRSQGHGYGSTDCGPP